MSKEKLRKKKTKKEKIRIEDVPLTDDTTCGIGPFRGPCLQWFATKAMYVLFYGALGFVQSATWSYLNGTISTMEKRFKIPSKVTGVIMTGSDISGFFTSVILSYWGGKGHRPRWIALSSCAAILQMLFTALPHALYGPGEDALRLTEEYSAGTNLTIYNTTTENMKKLCGANEPCIDDTGSFVQPAILFMSQFIQGFGGGLYYSLGVSYMDDNVKKSESPVLISLTYLLRMIGPTLGYILATVCLKIYIAPNLTPIITNDDPRWLGAWWMGWLMFAAATAVFVIPVSLFPKVLPETAAKKLIEDNPVKTVAEEDNHASFRDMIKTIKRLLTNKIYICNLGASIFYIVGETPYWTYIAKYMETQYKQSASVASFVSGTLGLVTSSIGIIVSGIFIAKVKPKARSLAAWNVFVGLFTTCGMISYIFIVCEDNSIKSAGDGSMSQFNTTLECNIDCDCDFMPYSPVCSEDGQTYISACHAGCTGIDDSNGTQIYTNCVCIEGADGPGIALSGLCPVDCQTSFYTFIAVMASMKLVGASGISSNFLVGVRCIDEKDKSAAIGLSMTLYRLLAFTPAPILYGYIMDTTCIVWGQTCTGTGNCWLYDGPSFSYFLNVTAASLVFIGTIFDMNVWYHSKSLKIFD